MASDQTKPIPWPITLGITLIPEGLPEREFIEEVKKVVRKCLALPTRELNAPGLIRKHDERIWAIIREVMAEG